MIGLPSTIVSSLSSVESTDWATVDVTDRKIIKNNKNSLTKKLCSIFFPFVSESNDTSSNNSAFLSCLSSHILFDSELPDAHTAPIFYLYNQTAIIFHYSFQHVGK